MSGDGVLSVRLPLSLLGTFRAEAEREGIGVHQAARRVISFLPSLSQENLNSLREPPRELDTPKISLYVGWRAIDVIASVSRNSPLSNSQIVRRVLFALLITKSLEFVQRGDDWELHLVQKALQE